MSRMFLISDTHFNHGNIIRYCGRPFSSVRTMNETMIENWNRAVRPDDLVIHLGDFALGDQREIRDLLGALNGRILFLEGNHDGELKGLRPLSPQVRLEAHGIPFLMLHNPAGCNGGWVIHGHQHDRVPFFQSMAHRINVSVEAIGYRPISIDEVVKRIPVAATVEAA